MPYDPTQPINHAWPGLLEPFSERIRARRRDDSFRRRLERAMIRDRVILDRLANEEERMSAVAARFYVRVVEKTGIGENRQGTVRLHPVSGSKGDANKSWSKYTPSGEISMTITNPTALDWFEERLQKDVAVTFEDRPEEETGA